MRVLILALLNTQVASTVSAQSIYVKNASSCSVEVRMHANDGGSYPVLSSSSFTLGTSFTRTFNQISDLNCSSCTPGWISPAGAPYTSPSLTSGPFTGAAWDAVLIRSSSGSSPFGALGPFVGTISISVPGCPGVTADWQYWSITDSYEVDLY